MHSIGSGCDCCRGAVLSRRGLLGAGIAGAMGFGAAAQSTMAPAAAVQELLDGNKRYVGQHPSSSSQDFANLRRSTAAKQQPFAAVLSCADSRVPVELVFDQSIGQLFVTRVAGNVASPDIIASLEYGAAVLGTRAIMVLGHSACGAVKATMDGKAVPGQISALFAAIRPAVEAGGGDLAAAIKANAKIQANLLATASPVLAGAIKDGKLQIVAGYYDLDSGVVSVLG